MTLREIILTARDTRLEPIEVPEWGCTVYVRVGITVGDVLGRPKSDASDTDYARWASFIILDETGARIFGDSEAAELARKSFAVVDRIVGRYHELNNPTGGQDDPKAPPVIPSSAPPSGSPAVSA
jgi:hypothetical protein